jgi:hypothetical protein
MTATITALPGTRMITAPGRTPMERAILLAWLAAEETEKPGSIPRPVLALCLSAYAAETLTGEALESAWREYLSAVREKRDAESGFFWAAMEGVARVNAQAALAVLVHGEVR